METADEIVACDQPNSSCNGSSSTLGTDRKPAAPISVTKPTAATGQARCSLTALRSSISVTRRSLQDFRPEDQWLECHHVSRYGHEFRARLRAAPPGRRSGP